MIITTSTAIKQQSLWGILQNIWFKKSCVVSNICMEVCISTQFVACNIHSMIIGITFVEKTI